MDFLMKESFTIFGIEIYFYAVIIVCGMISAGIIAAILFKRRGIKYDLILDVALWVIPLAIIGARLYYVVFALDEFDSFYDVINLRSGGLAIYGGVIGGAIGVAIVCRIKKLNFVKLADCIVVGLILGQCIGRWGNFINQEAYGVEVTNPKFFGLPFSVYIENNSAWHMATFFYESFWNFIGAIGLFCLAWFYRKKADGVVFSCYFIYYGIGRSIIEGFRTDSLYIGSTGIRVSQALSVCLVVAGVLMLLFFLWRYKQKQKLEVISIDSDIIKNEINEKVDEINKTEEIKNEINNTEEIKNEINKTEEIKNGEDKKNE